MELNEACVFLSDLTYTSVIILNSEEIIRAFCSSHHFHSSQNAFTPDGFHHLLERLSDDSIISFRDSLRMHMVLIRIQSIPVVIGPFCIDDLTDTAVELMIRRYDLKNLPVKNYRAYRTRYPLVTEEKIIHAARVLLAHIDPNHEHRTLMTINGELPRSLQSWEYSKENFEVLVNERYKAETEMMDHVKTGDTKAAIDKYRYLHNNVRFMSRVGSTLESSRISAGITRTTVRVAAMRASLPPIILDQLTGESARIIAACESREAMAKENERMIRVICEAVHRWRKETCSASVFTALYQIEHNYQDEINIEQMAEHLGISTEHLIRTFKKETGTTPHAYLLNVRMEEASKLLRSTNYTIQTISAQVGIEDASYFVKCFRKHFHVTPTQYRIGRLASS